jgi:hypothetical protein
LRDEIVRAFPPFGAGEMGMPCVCLSESTPEHLAHLIAVMQFAPWGIVIGREAANMVGGGTVAYVPKEVVDRFKACGLGHWAVRTGAGSTWMHEREWRVPAPQGGVKIGGLAAILVGDANWRPTPVVTEWMDVDTGQPVELGRAENPLAVPTTMDYPRLWRETPVWVWDQNTRQVMKYEPGKLC